MLTLTLVIPVYNEERHIKGCLDTVAAQSVKPNEVIVVDNNCTDRTIQIAKSYPFVQVVKEKNQGRGHARSAGFNAASSDIIGRIDADSRLKADWVERVLTRFSNDTSAVGLTGLGKGSILPGTNWLSNTLPARAYYWYVHAGFRTITMWGATMAVRKSVWNKVKSDTCLDDRIVHEDQDVSLWIAASGGKIVQDNSVMIATSGQTYRYLPKLWTYAKLYESTKRFHAENGNLNKVAKTSRLQLLPGLAASVMLSTVLVLASVVFFPVDYILVRTKGRNQL